jgi:hypothetical protein
MREFSVVLACQVSTQPVKLTKSATHVPLDNTKHHAQRMITIQMVKMTGAHVAKIAKQVDTKRSLERRRVLLAQKVCTQPISVQVSRLAAKIVMQDIIQTTSEVGCVHHAHADGNLTAGLSCARRVKVGHLHTKMEAVRVSPARQAK